MVPRTTEKQLAFIRLSNQAQLKIKLDDAKVDEDKFIICVQYAAIIERSISRKHSLWEATLPDEAIRRGVLDLIRWYLDKAKISPDTIGIDRNTALWHAIFYPELVAILLSRKANPNLQNFFGNTPLQEIAKCIGGIHTDKLLKSAALLVASGARADFRNNEISFYEFQGKFIQATELSFALTVQESFRGRSELFSFYEEEKEPKLLLSEKDLLDIELYQAVSTDEPQDHFKNLCSAPHFRERA
jgi:ankyrin repeat protein